MKKFLLLVLFFCLIILPASAITQAEVDNLMKDLNLANKYVKMADSYLKSGNYALANQYNETALKLTTSTYSKLMSSDLNPKDKKQLADNLNHAISEGYFSKGGIKLLMNPNDDTAYEEFNKSIPTYKAAPSLLISMANSFASKGYYTTAEKCISTALTATYLTKQSQTDMYKLRAYIRAKYLNDKTGAQQDYFQVKYLQQS